MFFVEMLLAVALAIIVIAILLPSRRYRGEEGTPLALFFFLLLFLMIWASGAWLTPIGPPFAGVYWVGFVVAALFLALLLFALARPSGPPREPGSVVPENAEEEAAAGSIIAFGIFFWALVIAAVIALIVRYV